MADNQKQIVQWFPGHMAKTRRLIKESLSLVDGVTEIIDARIPYSSSNPELEELINNKPRIVLLNKCDLADKNTTNQWVDYYKKKGVCAIPVDCRTGKGLNNYIVAVKEVLKDVIKKNEDRGMPGKALRIMVVGIPNTGKSSFINRMAGAAKAKVADKAGVTRHNQWFPIGNGIELLDTPGVLWPKFDDVEVGENLAVTGAIKDDILDTAEISIMLLRKLVRLYPDMLCTRYKLGTPEDIEDLQMFELFELIGRKRGFLVRGGEIDPDRTASVILDEFREGIIGRITLDRTEAE